MLMAQTWVHQHVYLVLMLVLMLKTDGGCEYVICIPYEQYDGMTMTMMVMMMTKTATQDRREDAVPI